MKVFISADIEGAAGVVSGEETTGNSRDYDTGRSQMTAEVRAAAEGAVNAGCEEIWVKDAHGSAQNIIFSELPQEVKLIRGWSDHPMRMMQELDASFDAALMIGYHDHAGSGKNPLAHTITGRIHQIKINGTKASEFLINSYAASMHGVPVVMISGDRGICEHARGINENISAVPVKEGKGDSIIGEHPELAVQNICSTAEKALRGTTENCLLPIPDQFEIFVEFSNRYHQQALKASFYPGVEQVNDTSVRYITQDYFAVMTMLNFIL